MPAKKIKDADFIRLWQEFRSPAEVSKITGLSLRNVYAQRAKLADEGHDLMTADPRCRDTNYSPAVKFERSRKYEIKNGVVIVWSDQHFYPDHSSVAMDALLTLIKELKPKAVISGGDELDGTQISRYDPTRGWHQPPSLKEQLDCLTENMDKVRKAAGKGCITAAVLGNHTARLSRYLAVNAPAVEDLPGTRIEDYMPGWPLSWTVEIAGKIPTYIRHRNLSGMLHLQAMRAGAHFVHGHLHKLNVHATPQYGRFLFSVDAGSFADPTSDAFDYAEDSPGHVQGFCVLTYKDGELMWPELCWIRDGKAYFRGTVV